MTLEEAQTVGELLASAHGGSCTGCARDGIAHFFRRFPEVDREGVLKYLVKEGCVTEKTAETVRRAVVLK